MAIFRGGVKIGKFDVRTGLSKERAQGILRKTGIIEDDKGRGKYEKDAMGEIQAIRTVIGMGEGFTQPANFKIRFQAPKGIEHASGGPRQPDSPGAGRVKTGGLDWKTHIMNNSTNVLLAQRYQLARQVARTTHNPTGSDADKTERTESKLDLYCSKVTIPEKSIAAGPYTHHGTSFAYPTTAPTYGQLTTSFYCDGTMHIKNFFDAWQKLIYNDMTGNFNFYNEYISTFDIFTLTTMTKGAKLATAKEEDDSLFGKIQGISNKVSAAIKEGTNEFNKLTGVDGPRSDPQNKNDIPTTVFRENYGIKVFECWPSIVGGISLSHDGSNSIASFDVTWQYAKWNPFKMGNVGRREINLAIGEFRNEKDGFPFIEDLPPELAGPLTGAIGQGINTGPLSKAAPLFG